jgi:hypothetical protein
MKRVLVTPLCWVLLQLAALLDSDEGDWPLQWYFRLDAWAGDDDTPRGRVA